MKCDEVVERFFAAEDGALAPELAEQVRRHVEGCPRCRELLALDRLIVGASRTPPPPPPDLHDRVWQAFQESRVRLGCQLLRNALVVAFLGAAARPDRRNVPRGAEEKTAWSDVVSVGGVSFPIELSSPRNAPHACRVQISLPPGAAGPAAALRVELRREGTELTEDRYLEQGPAEFRGLTAGRHALTFFRGDAYLGEIEFTVEDGLAADASLSNRPAPEGRGGDFPAARRNGRQSEVG